MGTILNDQVKRLVRNGAHFGQHEVHPDGRKVDDTPNQNYIQNYLCTMDSIVKGHLSLHCRLQSPHMGYYNTAYLEKSKMSRDPFFRQIDRL